MAGERQLDPKPVGEEIWRRFHLLTIDRLDWETVFFIAGFMFVGLESTGILNDISTQLFQCAHARPKYFA